VIGNLLQPIFNAGKNKRRVEVNESQQRQSLYAYERTILEAFRETEDALVGFRKTGEQRTATTGRVAAQRKVLELAELRYKGRRLGLSRGARRPALALQRRARRSRDDRQPPRLAGEALQGARRRLAAGAGAAAHDHDDDPDAIRPEDRR
jgi:hypothetical protein